MKNYKREENIFIYFYKIYFLKIILVFLWSSFASLSSYCVINLDINNFYACAEMQYLLIRNLKLILKSFNHTSYMLNNKKYSVFCTKFLWGAHVNSLTLLSDSCNFKTLFPGRDNGNKS